MVQSKGLNKYALLAAVCFLVGRPISQMVSYFHPENIMTYYGIEFTEVFRGIVRFTPQILLVVLAILLSLNIKNISLAIVSGAIAILKLIWLLMVLPDSYSTYTTFYFIIEFLLEVSILPLILVYCVVPVHLEGKRAKIIWFIPGMLALLLYVLKVIVFYFAYQEILTFINTIKVLIPDVANHLASYFLLGCCLKQTYVAGESCINLKPIKAMNKKEAVHKMTNFNEADKLKQFKELLDAGILTQEEFDQKKKELLSVPSYNYTTRSAQSVSPEEDIPSTGLNVLSFFIPIVGVVLYILYHEKTPVKANAIAKWALIGFIVSIVLSGIYYAVALSSFMYY